MQITCEHKLACSWLAASELDHNLFLNLEFSTQSLLEIRLQNTTVNLKLWSLFEVASDSRMHIRELIPCGIYSLRPRIFNRKAVLSLVKCAPK